MGARADWHTRPVDVDDSDPFAAAPVPIRLDGEHAALDRRLVELLHIEWRLFDEGVTCSIRDYPGTSCHACPLNHASDQGTGRLCGVGMEQERVLSRLAAEQRGG